MLKLPTARIDSVVRRSLLARLWRDQSGETSTAALILIAAILGIGAMVGLVAVRDQMAQELGDTAAALTNLDQSYSYSIEIDTDGDGVFDKIVAAQYPGPGQTQNEMVQDNDGAPPGCMNISN